MALFQPTKFENPYTIHKFEDDFYQKYNLKKVQFLGEGMAGKVYLVKPKSGRGRWQAVKEFSHYPTEVRERNMKHFVMETTVMQVVSHPHLVPCHLAASGHDYSAIVMPYYPQGDLVLSGRQEPNRVHRLMSQVARAVEHIHKWNIAHNDIKLENVFVDGSDDAHLGDMGFALRVKDPLGFSPAWRVGGTKDYWSPEKLAADPHDKIDPFKCDVYAVGIMYWVLVTGIMDFTAGTDFVSKLAETQDLNISNLQM
ncbi:hypothetical protein EGW08_003589 [Elysia chlorotica]|uniref:Protein kinase domain-containing protein n=1 Tax=Elysia chlorotica TaxID=188477 RepID=A0A433U4B6_ELYCH|nr:hypothetical protein EGW08_003589 [Elysia chlorotica]